MIVFLVNVFYGSLIGFIGFVIYHNIILTIKFKLINSTDHFEDLSDRIKNNINKR